MQIRRNHHYRNSRNTHQAQAKVKRVVAQAFLDMKSVAVFVRFSNLFGFPVNNAPEATFARRNSRTSTAK